jgi:hypothetical protein
MLLVSMIVFALSLKVYDYNGMSLRAPYAGVECSHLEKVMMGW